MRVLKGRYQSWLRWLQGAAVPCWNDFAQIHPESGFTVACKSLTRSLAFLGAFTLLIVDPEPIAAQLFGTSRQMLPGRFIEVPRSVQQQLREAERAVEEDRYSDAVVRLGDLLASDSDALGDIDLSGQDFFLDLDDVIDSDRPFRRSFMRTARDMIAELPTSALETYELRYGPSARKLLAEAAAERDWTKVREVRRKYFHTMAGYDASLLLAQHEMFGGHPLAASMLLDDVVKVPRAVKRLGDSVLLLHAATCRLSGRDLPELAAPRGDLQVAGESVPWPSDDELSDWLVARFGNVDLIGSSQIKDYPLLGARANRNGASSGQLPLENLRWQLDTTASPRQERKIRRIADEIATNSKLPPPSWVPLRVGSQLLMRTSERLVGVDYQTGKRVWTYPWQTGYEEVESEETILDSLPGESEADDLWTQRVWNDVPYGQVSSDGKRVYLLDDLKKIEAAIYGAGRIRAGRPTDTSSNTLVALDLATEGKLRWRLGVGADEASTLSDAFFLGPPLPLDGRLYVMVEIAGDINVCCLDPETGDEIWRQQIVAVESGAIHTDPIRRVAGAMPTYHEGLLICPTGAGAMVAIDLGDQTLRWGVHLERNQVMSRSVGGRGRAVESKQLMQRWFTGAAVADGKSLLVTPIESDRLFGFDLLTGEKLFPEKNRLSRRYVAGIRGDKFFVVESNGVTAHELSNGRTVWKTPRDFLSVGQQISGLGVFGDGVYYVPSTANQIIGISLADGSVVERRTTRFPLGNLVAADGEIIAQGATTLSVAFGEKTLEPLVNRILEKDPSNFDAIVRKSELLLQHGQRDEALDLLEQARQMQPDNDEVRMLSVSAMLGTLRDDLEGNEGLADTLDLLIDRPSQRVELLALRIRAAMADGQYEEAARQLIDLSSLVVSEPLLESSADQVVADPSRDCSLDGWISGQSHDLFRSASEEQLTAINELVLAEAESKSEGSTNLLQRLYRHFGVMDGIEPIRRELANRMLADGAYLELERLAVGPMIPSSTNFADLSSDRLIMLANAYVSGRMPDNALAVLDVLSTRDVSDQPGVVDEVTALRGAAESQIATYQWPKKVSRRWDTRKTRGTALIPRTTVYETQQLAGPQFRGWRLAGESSSSISVRDPDGIMRRVPLEGALSDNTDKEAQVSGGVMVVMTTSGLLGIDLYHLLVGDGQAMLWTRGPGDDGEALAKRRSTMTPFGAPAVRYCINSATASGGVIPELKLGPVMGDRVLLLQGGELLAIDVITGETIWRNSGAPQSGTVVCGGDRVAVVSSSTEQVVEFDLLDGRKLSTKRWKYGVVWGSAGRNLLCYRSAGIDRMYDVLLVNPFDDQVILKQTAFSSNRSKADVPCSYGRVVSGRYFVMLNHLGECLIWDIRDAVEIGRPQLPPYKDLQDLNVLAMKGQLLLLPKRRLKPPSNPPRTVLTIEGSIHRTVSDLHAVSLLDGTINWSKELDEPWGCTLTQPADSPLVLLSRGPRNISNTSRRRELDVLAVDIRDGSELERSQGKPVDSGYNYLSTKLTVQPSLSRVIAQIGPKEMITYSFGDAANPGVGNSELDSYEQQMRALRPQRNAPAVPGQQGDGAEDDSEE